MNCLLAIDSGGTKCEAMAFSEDGGVLGWGYVDGTTIDGRSYPIGPGRSREAVTEAAAQALKGVRYDELTVINGTWDVVDLDGKRHPVIFVSEAAAALALVGLESGVVVVAGTGSCVFGKTDDGHEFFLDGLGPMLGDYGGGYQIGYMALRAASRSGWHPRHHTSLGMAIRRKVVGVNENEDTGRSFIEFSLSDPTRADIARLARIVSDEATKGDAIALQILNECVASLADTVFDVVDRLGMTSDYRMVGTGSLATRSSIYWQTLCSKVHEFAPGIQPIISDLPPVVGLGVVALKETPNHAEPVASLLRSAREYGLAHTRFH